MSDGIYESQMGERRAPKAEDLAEGAKAQEPAPLTPREEAIAEMRRRHGGQGRTSEDLFALELGRVLQLLQGVKEWRDRETNDGFPNELRAEIEQELVNDARRVKGIVDRLGLGALPGWYAKDLSISGYPSIVYKQPGSNKVHSYDEMVAAVKGAENVPSLEEREEAKKELAKEFNILWGDYFPRGLIDERVTSNRRAKKIAELNAQLAAVAQDRDKYKQALVAMEVRQINSTLDRVQKQDQKCSDCKHYWERRGRCTKAVDPADPRENGPGRPWYEPSTCAPPWCPGFEPHAFPSEVHSNFPPGETSSLSYQAPSGEVVVRDELVQIAARHKKDVDTATIGDAAIAMVLPPRWTAAAARGRFMLVGHFTFEQMQQIHALKLDCEHQLFGEFRAGHSGGYVCTDCMRAFWDGSPEVEEYQRRRTASAAIEHDEDEQEDDDAD